MPLGRSNVASRIWNNHSIAVDMQNSRSYNKDGSNSG